MEARPARLNIDSYQARASVSPAGQRTSDVIRDEGQKGIRIAYQGTARIVEEGNQIARGSSPVDIAVQNQRAGFSIETFMDFIPKTGPDFSYDAGVLNINYQVDDKNIDWEHLEAARLIFNPGSVEINVTEHARVEIEYVGEPIYVPPSANPNYAAVHA
jgi:hypothetical protein